MPVVPLADPSGSGVTQWYPLPVVCQMFRQQGRYWDLEMLLEGSRGIRAEDRKMVYFWTLQAYADVGLFDRAVALSGQLHLEGLGHHFPEYHQLMSSFAAAHTSFAPTMPYSAYAFATGQSLFSRICLYFQFSFHFDLISNRSGINQEILHFFDDFYPTNNSSQLP